MNTLKLTPENAMQGLVLATVVFAVAGFAFMVIRAMWLTIDDDATPSISQEYTLVATGLAGLVGGVVAVGLGQADPRRAGGPAAPPTVMGRALPSEALRKWALVGYTAVYLVLGVGCIVLWVQDQRPADLVKNEATVALGLLVPTAAAFFRSP